MELGLWVMVSVSDRYFKPLRIPSVILTRALVGP